MRYYADEAQRIMQPIACPQVHGGTLRRDPANAQVGYQYGVTGETNTLAPDCAWCVGVHQPVELPAGHLHGPGRCRTGYWQHRAWPSPPSKRPARGQSRRESDGRTAGVPADALQLLHGAGETVGAALVAQPGVAGVVFTGSTQVAKIIQRALAAKDGPIVPLIAETGGINAMLVDSSALPEQVVDAVVHERLPLRRSALLCAAPAGGARARLPMA